MEYYKNIVDEYIPKSIINNYTNTIIKNSCFYALNNGKRLRPIIIISLINPNNLKNNIDAYLDCALSIEFIHCASLIIDDMPCMDNDDYRRDQYSLHKYTDETIAQICAMCLVTSALKSLLKGLDILQYKCDDKIKLFSELINDISIDGIIDGQFNDILLSKNKIDKNTSTIKNIIDKKTGTLFELTFVLGYILNNLDKNVDEKTIHDMRKIGKYFGRCFQIYDDICDKDTDKNNSANYLLHHGKNKTKQDFCKYMNLYKKILKKYKMLNPCIKQITHFLGHEIKKL
jgi:geranylgeranyl diphosphate synthase type II